MSENIRVDQAALVGVAVAGIISISSAEGRYEPFDAAIGIVLALLLASFYRPDRSSSVSRLVLQSAASAAVFSLVLCIIAAPVLDAYVRPLTEDGSQADNVRVSRMLLNLWLCMFVVGFDLLICTVLRPRSECSDAIARAAAAP